MPLEKVVGKGDSPENINTVLTNIHSEIKSVDQTSHLILEDNSNNILKTDVPNIPVNIKGIKFKKKPERFPRRNVRPKKYKISPQNMKGWLEEFDL